MNWLCKYNCTRLTADATNLFSWFIEYKSHVLLSVFSYHEFSHGASSPAHLDSSSDNDDHLCDRGDFCSEAVQEAATWRGHCWDSDSRTQESH